MDINEIKSLCAVDTFHNYTEAADGIASSPAVISKHVAKIEKELGIRIFERASKTRPVELTPAGRELMAYFRSIVRIYDEMLGKSAELRSELHSRLTIGYTPFIGNFHEADIIAQMYIKNPEIAIKRRTLGVPELVRAMLVGTLDAVFLPIMVGKEIDYSIYGVLSEDEFIVDEIFRLKNLTIGIPDGHPLAGCEKITEDMFPILRKETFLFSGADQAPMLACRQRQQLYDVLGFEEENMKVRFIDFCEPSVALRLVETGEGILPQACVVPRKIGKVNFIPVENDKICTALYYIQRRDVSCRALQKLRACVKEFKENYRAEHSEDSEN